MDNGGRRRNEKARRVDKEKRSALEGIFRDFRDYSDVHGITLGNARGLIARAYDCAPPKPTQLEETNKLWESYLSPLLDDGMKWTGWKTHQTTTHLSSQLYYRLQSGKLAYAAYPGKEGLIDMGGVIDAGGYWEQQSPIEHDDLVRQRDPRVIQEICDDMLSRLRKVLAEYRGPRP